MQHRKAIQILQAMVAGVDPDTGKSLDTDSVVQKPSVLRALLVATKALEEQASRAVRRASLPTNTGNPWTADEERLLVQAFQQGDSREDMAAQLERSVRGIEARLERLGLITASERQTRSRL
jgi:DNA-binding NarL/FixJ family response regulator